MNNPFPSFSEINIKFLIKVKLEINMYKIERIAISLLLMCFWNVGLAHCQDKMVTIGLKGGMNASNFFIRTNAFGDGLRNIWKPLLLPHIGVSAERPIFKKISGQAELLYSINGSSFLLSRSYAHFISLPVLLSITTFKHIKFELGPQVSFIYKSKKSNLLIDTDKDLGVVGGCRVNMIKNLSIGLRYVQGVAPLGKLIAVDVYGNPRQIKDFYARNLQLTVQYELHPK